MKNFSLKILAKTALKWGIYNPQKNLPVGREKAKIGFPVDRPTVKKVTVEPCGRTPGRPCQLREQRLSGRSTARSTETEKKSNALCPVDRPVDRRLSREQSSLAVNRDGRRPPQLGCVHILCTSVDRPDRSPTATVDRQSASLTFLGQKNLGF